MACGFVLSGILSTRCRRTSAQAMKLPGSLMAWLRLWQRYTAHEYVNVSVVGTASPCPRGPRAGADPAGQDAPGADAAGQDTPKPPDRPLQQRLPWPRPRPQAGRSRGVGREDMGH